MAEEESTSTPRRRGRAGSGAAGPRSTVTTRRRRIGGAELVETLNEMVSQLIKENRSLKRQLAKLTAGGGSSAANGIAERTLRTLQRKVQRAVAAVPTPRRRRGTSASPGTRARSPRRRSAATEPKSAGPSLPKALLK